MIGFVSVPPAFADQESSQVKGVFARPGSEEVWMRGV